ELIHRIEREDSAALTANTLLAVCVQVEAIVNQVKKLNRGKNNKGFLSELLPSYISGILDLKVEPLPVFNVEQITLNKQK
ncbi:MAG: hypothetical protein LBK58_11600, partial [Prevotellaceae bacterium]|nr:hypothetical protein [Prevotellaceae bacterium]